MGGINWYEVILTMLLGVIGFFLKRTMSGHDDIQARVKHLECDHVSQKELEQFENKFYSKLDEVQKDVKEIRVDYINKNDFIRELAKIDSKIDKLMDLIIDERRNQR